MGELHTGLCKGCVPARALLEGVSMELVAVEAQRMMLTSERQRQSWRDFYNNHPAGDQALVRRGQQYTDADHFAEAMTRAVVVGCSVQEGRVRDLERRTLGVMSICPRLLEQMVQLEPAVVTPVIGTECASGERIGALQEEFNDICW